MPFVGADHRVVAEALKQVGRIPDLPQQCLLARFRDRAVRLVTKTEVKDVQLLPHLAGDCVADREDMAPGYSAGISVADSVQRAKVDGIDDLRLPG